MAIALFAAVPGAAAGAAGIVTADFQVPALDAGIELHVHNRHPPSSPSDPGRGIVLFVHGATFPASSTFDVPIQGASWMERLAADGYDTYALDVRGYGGSTRPAAMSQPPEANAPFARTAEAVRDISAVVDFILARRKATQLTLIGWSWGTTTTAAYAAQHPDKVHALVLVSPVWVGVQPPKYTGAYRTSTRESARAFATAGMPKERIEEISPTANFDAWWKATLATDADGARQTPPVVRSPNGVLQDFAELWAAGKAGAYDPANIRAPTLLVVGEWDVITPPSMAQALFPRLTNARERRLIQFSEATHFLVIEKHRERLVREVQNFLHEQ
ncbi:MAG TPA: alpha/beta fold hydrolase [Steroidobacteraceae bacterium]|nr:alpha/beta fold hydrolase [Steroidobacteraceae bacterium]